MGISYPSKSHKVFIFPPVLSLPQNTPSDIVEAFAGALMC